MVIIQSHVTIAHLLTNVTHLLTNVTHLLTNVTHLLTNVTHLRIIFSVSAVLSAFNRTECGTG